MAFINMFNPDHQGGLTPMSPRISFSNDFVQLSNTTSPPPSAAASPADPNFEFSVGSRPMMAADELFFKGRMLPLRGSGGGGSHRNTRGGGATTLRDELQAPDHPWDGARTPRGSTIRWREMLGLRRPQCHSKSKLDKVAGDDDVDGEAIASKSSEEPRGDTA